jgi:hypothetical protein
MAPLYSPPPRSVDTRREIKPMRTRSHANFDANLDANLDANTGGIDEHL